jgi:hypothetical protein
LKLDACLRCNSKPYQLSTSSTRAAVCSAITHRAPQRKVRCPIASCHDFQALLVVAYIKEAPVIRCTQYCSLSESCQLLRAGSHALLYGSTMIQILLLSTVLGLVPFLDVAYARDLTGADSRRVGPQPRILNTLNRVSTIPCTTPSSSPKNDVRRD